MSQRDPFDESDGYTSAAIAVVLFLGIAFSLYQWETPRLVLLIIVIVALLIGATQALWQILR